MPDKLIDRFKFIFSITLAVVCAGCSFKPEYISPELPVPDVYPNGHGQVRTLSNTPSSDTSPGRWQDYFLDSSLQILIKQALNNNRDLRTMTLRVKEAQAAYGIQRSDLMPSVSGSAATARLGLPAEITPIAGGRPISQYIAGFNTSWELDFWGRVQNLNDAALNEYLATDAARIAAQNSLIAQVADTYLNLLDLNERITIAQNAIISRQKSFDMLKRRYEVGSGNKLDVVQAETLLTQAQSLATQLQQTQTTQINLLAFLVGDAKSIDTINTTLQNARLKDDLLIATLPFGQPSDLLLRRPDIIASEYRLKGANANIGAARAAFFPRITLNAAYGGISTELNGLFDANNRAWMFAPNISIPIFMGGRLASNLELTEVRQEIAVANYEKTIQIAFKEVADNLAATQTLTRQIEIQQRAVDAQMERVRLARMRYDNGSSSYFEVLDAERDLLNVQQQLVQIRRAQLATRVNLFNALGGAIDTGIEAHAEPQSVLTIQTVRSNR